MIKTYKIDASCNNGEREFHIWYLQFYSNSAPFTYASDCPLSSVIPNR
jgi:hypothetical protein